MSPFQHYMEAFQRIFNFSITPLFEGQQNYIGSVNKQVRQLQIFYAVDALRGRHVTQIKALINVDAFI